jgi:hypothetical protein
MDKAKVKAVEEWPMPSNLREVWGFLGFANFYCRFIEGFAQIARPLNDLTKKGVKFYWGSAQEEAFEMLKQSFITAPILSLWDPDRPTRVEVDASGFAAGGVITQKLPDGLWHPIVFRSASMDETQ